MAAGVLVECIWACAVDLRTQVETMRRREYFVYLLRSSLDGIVFYVGKGSCNRLSGHLGLANSGSGLPVHQKIRAVLGAGGQVIYEKVFQTDEEFLAFDEECRIIRAFGRQNLTNQTNGGEGSSGSVHSRESVERRAIKLRGNKYPWLSARNKDPKFRKKVSAGVKRAIAEGRLSVPDYTGVKVSAETRLRLRESHLGKKLSPESIAKRTESVIGSTRSDETRARMRKTHLARSAINSATMTRIWAERRSGKKGLELASNN